ncbi:MAG TPA: winged helix-turn-helix domain-containing protein [archaeon]|nr:winged helix-turn-helix domain-containing protein [archaeon]
MIVRRSQVHIFIDILRLINKKGLAKPTHILYGANLSHLRLKRYLETLQVAGFVEKTDEKNQVFYKTTKKGNDFLKEFKKVEELSEAFGVPI